MPRKVTNQILEMIEGGTLNKDEVILACLLYMSEYDVEDMAHHNGFLYEEESEDEE